MDIPAASRGAGARSMSRSGRDQSDRGRSWFTRRPVDSPLNLSTDQAVIRALQARLKQLRRGGAPALVDELDEIARHCASLPVQDSRQGDEILGFGAEGQRDFDLFLAKAAISMLRRASALFTR